MKKFIYTLLFMLFAFSLVSCTESRNNIRDVKKFINSWSKHHQDEKIENMFNLNENVYSFKGTKEGKDGAYTYTKEFLFIGNMSSYKLNMIKSKYFYFEQLTKMTNFKDTKTYTEKIYFINGEIYYQIQSEYENKTYKYYLTCEYFKVYLEAIGNTGLILSYFQYPSSVSNETSTSIYVNDKHLEIEREFTIPEKYKYYNDEYTYHNLENYYYNNEFNLEKITLKTFKQNTEKTTDQMNGNYSIMLYDEYFDFIVPYFYDEIGHISSSMIDVDFYEKYSEIYL